MLAPTGEVRLAQAWVTATEGSVSEALALAHQAAEVAASHTNPPWGGRVAYRGLFR